MPAKQAENRFLAIDLGADSGRGLIGSIGQDKISLKEVNRFPTRMFNLLGHYHWDIYRFHEEIVQTIQACAQEPSLKPLSLGIDTWGVDFGLLAGNGALLQIPFGYRDHRTEGMMEEVFQKVSKDKLYSITGIQFMRLNSLYQLYAMKHEGSPLLDVATDLLFIPDLLNYFLTGIKKTEYTFATTSQMLSVHDSTWSKEIFDSLGLPVHIMQEIVQPGTIQGFLHPATKKACKNADVQVVNVGSHDTASAIAAVPATDDNFAYISSGTWSLMGIENKQAIATQEAMKYNFTNEGGVEGTYRFLKNIMGLWLIQSCKRCWDAEGNEYSYPEIVEMARQAIPFQQLLNPDDEVFMNPGNMLQAINEFCKQTNQPIPGNPGQYARAIFESLALKYRQVIDELREVSDKNIERVHIFGGGAQNQMLCQFAANASGLPVVAGPFEATAIGNLIMQALAFGNIESLSRAREMVGRSFPMARYEPRENGDWEKPYQVFKQIQNK